MEMSSVIFPPIGSNVITVDGYNREGRLDTIRLLKTPRTRLGTLQLLNHTQGQIVKQSYNTVLTNGLTPARYRCCQKIQCRKNLLPQVTTTDYDLPLSTDNGLTGSGAFVGEIAWLVDGNDANQLPATPIDGFFDLGILATEGELATAGIDIITVGAPRIRINGDAANDPLYQSTEVGKVIIANGFIEQIDIPALFAPILGPALPPPFIAVLPPFADIYLERPSNAYNVIVPDSFGTLIPLTYDPLNPADAIYTPFVDTDPAVIGTRVVYLNNIFLGDQPLGAPTSTIGYSQVSATPLVGFPLGIDTFNYLLKVINPGTTGISIYFNSPVGAPDLSGFRFIDIYPNATTIPFVVPANSAIFFQMRVEEGTTHIMLDNITYTPYVEASP